MSKYTKNDKETILPQFTLNITINSSRASPMHPSFEVTDSIYAQEHSKFVSRLSTPNEEPKIIKMRIPGAPIFKYLDPHEKMYGKEDIYSNPTALYLSRKPLAYSRAHRRASITAERIVSFTPALEIPKTIRLRQNHKRSISISRDNPLKDLRILKKQKTKKILHQKALEIIEKACEDMEYFPNITPKVKKEKKMIEDYMKKFQWTTSVLKSYSGQESEVLRQLYILSDNSRNELNKDMASTAEEIKRGTMDPALRHKKRKLIQL